MSYPKFKEMTEERRNQIIQNFKLLENEFKSLGYEIALHGGSLLGAMREGDLIEEDNDIDFIILHKGTNREEVKKEIVKINDYFQEKKRLCKDLHFLGNNHYFVNECHFDGWSCWTENNKAYICFDIYEELVPEDIYPLKKIRFHGEEFNIINNSEKLLEIMYGTTWNKKENKKHKYKAKQLYLFFNGARYLAKERIVTQKEILLDLKSLLEAHEITFWLMAGTLLGAVREGNFLVHDPKDIDIGLDIKDYWKVKSLLDKSDFKYKYQWNKELAVYKGHDVHPHIDLFFHTSDEDNYYCYSYKPNRISSIWNEEWRMKIAKNLIEPLKIIQFLDEDFRVPGKTEEYLETLYGPTWRIPDPTWKYTGFNNIDNDYQAITAIVTTFNRPECLDKLIKSFTNLYPDIPLIIGNQNKYDLKYDYTSNILPNIKVVQLPEDCGLSYARNELVKHVKTEYVLLLEDDFILTKKTDIYKMLEVFAYDKNIGIVGGRLEENNIVKKYEKYLFVLDKLLLSINWEALRQQGLVKEYVFNRLVFGYADIIFNFFLAKTDVLKQCPWDNKHKCHSEHMDFFLNLKLNSTNKVVFIPDVLIQHSHPKESEEYAQYRKRMYYNYIYEKYNIEKGYTIGEQAIMNYKENKKENL